MLTQDEKNYLAKIDPNKKVSVSAFDPIAKETGELIVEKIRSKLPKAKVLFMGATALEIAGQNDIDIYVLSDRNEFSKYLPTLQKLFGKPRNIHETFIEWSFTEKGKPVELYLTEPPERQIKVFEILKSDKKLLKECEDIKLKFNGKSFRDYQKAKYEFNNRILAHKNHSTMLSNGILTIKPFVQENAQEHLANEDEEQVKWLSGEKGTLEGVKKWILKNQKYWENDGPVFNFAIFDKNNNLIGMVEANTDPSQVEGINEGEANVSYLIYPKFRGKGHAARAINLICKFLKQKGIKRAVAGVDPKNENSLKVPLRCGFEEDGIITLKNKEKEIKFVRNL
ncbi:GNAT family N-acetyltransferase [Candidatus Woesebacteria bacterium]|nr:GNAT family N-acetyltransferase [Candidatus Woesebacteria bacterium]